MGTLIGDGDLVAEYLNAMTTVNGIHLLCVEVEAAMLQTDISHVP